MALLMQMLESVLAAVGIALLVIYMMERQKRQRYNQLAHASSTSAPGLSLHTGNTAADATAAAAVDSSKPRLVIVFASQSGVAQSLAEGLAEEASAYGIPGFAVDIEEYDFAENMAKEDLLVWYVATYGEGDPTDSCTEFDEWIMREDLDDDLLEDRHFAVFGLGNRQYEYFNAMGIKYDKRFERLGGRRLVPIGLGDDDGSIEEDHETWKLALWPQIHKHFCITPDTSLNSSVLPSKPSFRIVYVEDDGDDAADEGGEQTPWCPSGYELGELIDSRELLAHPTSKRSTKHLVVDISGTSLSGAYHTAGNVAIRPRNPFKMVAQLCKRLRIREPDRRFVLKPLASQPPGTPKRAPVSGRVSARDALLWHVDICSVPRKRVLGFLSQYTSDASDKASLTRLALPDGKDAYHEQYVVGKRTLLETLDTFTSCHPPLEHLLEELPPLAPRFFSASSSSLAHPQQLHLTVSLVVDDLPQQREHRGVASSYLTQMRAAATNKPLLALQMRESAFRRPHDPHTPVIMIAAGTGIAPFRGFILDAMHTRNNGGGGVSDWHLFFGCRNEHDDFVYASEMRAAARSGVLAGLHVAFSRDQQHKVYVQHLVHDQRCLLRELIRERNAHVYVCGATHMGRAVRDQFRRLLADNDDDDENGAGAAYVQRMVEQGRYVAELWG